MDPWWYFELAAKVAEKQSDKRSHKLGAVGLRSDGVMVAAYNGAAKAEMPQIHAEARLCRKMDYYGTVFVARRTVNGFLLARPCAACQRTLKSRRVRRVFYTVSNNEYGVIDL